MVDTMYAAPGIGLAAPQIGVPLRVCVIDLSVGKRGGELLTLINPEFVERDGMQLEEEGCLSVPGLQRHGRAAGPRASCARSTATAASASIEGTGLLARALQHEIDHLDGLLFLDRLRGIKRDLIVREDPEAAARRALVMPLRVALLRHAGVRGAHARARSSARRTRSSASSRSRTGRAAAASKSRPKPSSARADALALPVLQPERLKDDARCCDRSTRSRPTSASSPPTGGSCRRRCSTCRASA